MNISEMVKNVLNEGHSDVASSADMNAQNRRHTYKGSKFNKDYYDNMAKKSLNRGAVTAGGLTILGGAAALAKERMTKTPETTKIVAKSFKDSVKDRVMEHPKAAMAAGAASALGAGYGAYKYMKNRKGKKK